LGWSAELKASELDKHGCLPSSIKKIHGKGDKLGKDTKKYFANKQGSKLQKLEMHSANK
jgi:hypothetical protein